MKTFQQFCEPKTKELGAPAGDVSPTITKWANEYGEYVRQYLMLRIQQLETDFERVTEKLGQAQMAIAHYEGLFHKANDEGPSIDKDRRIAQLMLALEECHDALQLEECQHATEEYTFTNHPLLEKELS